MSPAARDSFMSAEPISEGVLLAHFRMKGKRLSLIAAYATTPDYDDSETETFYSEVQEALNRTANRDCILIGGDFNAQLGAEDPQHWQGCLGKFALKKENLKSNKMTRFLLDFCLENLVVS